MAEPTRLEPATSAVTGRRSNQLSYDSITFIITQVKRKCKGEVSSAIIEQLRCSC